MTTTARNPDELAAELEELRAQLAAKTRIASRALATYQQRTLLMEEHAAELRAANEEVRRVNDRLSEALRVLEERDRRITDDLEQARRFQERILPAPPEADRLRFSVFYRPAELVGGDVYDIWERSPGHFRVFLADATGHGVQAALRTMLLKAEYDRIKIEAKAPEELLVALNGRIAAVYPGLELQCTASCLDVELGPEGSARVRYATAAHPPLLHVQRAQTVSVYQPGPFLGVVPHIELEQVELTLQAGERLLVYSDGLAEQWNAQGSEFGIERVEAALADRTVDLEAAVNRLIADWDAFLGGRTPDDDATLVGIERLR
jgi:serine phosphatase RsbU (regulator of sigma subunit)